MARQNAAAASASRRPVDSDFYQQRLKAWQPILTPKWVIAVFLTIGIPFVIIGFIIRVYDERVEEYRVQYDGEGTEAKYAACQLGDRANSTCDITFNIEREMKAPVYLYYELSNFYQNHRRYVKSRSDKQLAGTIYTDPNDVKADCDPMATVSTRDSANNSVTKVLHPCGLIANSYFTDSYKLLTQPGGLTLDETGIAWASDLDKKFKPVRATVDANPSLANKVQFIWETYPGVKDVNDEHFVVWMRVAALPDFRKLYGHIDNTIPAGSQLTFRVNANYPVTSFQGKKALVLSTVSFLGGKNPFLGIAYIVVGFACIGLAILFGLKQLLGGRKLGDTSYLHFNSHRSR